MMPNCSWKRCHKVGLNKIGVDIEWQHPYICDKHMNKLLKRLGISATVTDGQEVKSKLENGKDYEDE